MYGCIRVTDQVLKVCAEMRLDFFCWVLSTDTWKVIWAFYYPLYADTCLVQEQFSGLETVPVKHFIYHNLPKHLVPKILLQ